MNQFENRINYNIGYKSRIIASWVNVGGKVRTRKDRELFKKWMISIGISEEDAKDVKYFATNGKLEYEGAARQFLNEQENQSEETES